MPINIFVAKTPKQIDEVFKVRHRVFSVEDKLLHETKDKRLIDRFDAIPTSKNLIVVLEERDDDRVVGALRMTLDSEVGLPADEYYDFRKHLPKDAKVIHVGMFCVQQKYRNPRVTTDLMLMATYYGKSNGVTHVLAPINPKIAKLLQRVGFEAVGEEFIEPSLDNAVVPLILDVEKLNDFFLNFVKQNQLQDFLGDYERSFYQKGEYVIKAGEKGEYAYLIISGTAFVNLPKSGGSIAEIKEGEVFGELALLTDELRFADIVAPSDLQVMRLSKAIFVEYFFNQPKQAQKLLKLMGNRTQKLIGQLEEAKRGILPQ